MLCGVKGFRSLVRGCCRIQHVAFRLLWHFMYEGRCGLYKAVASIYIRLSWA